MAHRRFDGRRIAGAKNIVRGALSNKGARPVEVLADVIEELAPEDRSLFGEWVDRYPGQRARLCPPTKITKWAELWSGSYLTFTNITCALQWNARFLSTRLGQVSTFLTYLEQYEACFFAGKYDAASRILDQLEADLGLSYWLIETKIALLQRSRGLESQKAFANSLIEVIPRTVTAYFLRYVSQRNEEATSIDRFNINLSADIDGQEIRDATKLFLKARLLDAPHSRAHAVDLCTTLCVEASISVIDAYNGHIKALTQIMRRPDLASLRFLFRESKNILQVNDWRLQKLAILSGATFPDLPLQPLDAEESFCRGDYHLACKQALAYLHASPADVHSLVVAAECYAITETEPAVGSLSSIQSELLLGFTALASRAGSVEKAASDIAKISLNHGGLPCMQAVAGYRVSLWADTPQIGPSDASATFEASPSLNPTHWRLLPPVAANSLLAFYHEKAGDSSAVSLARASLIEGPAPSDIEPDVVLANAIWGALYNGDLERALLNAKALTTSRSSVWSRFNTVHLTTF